MFNSYSVSNKNIVSTHVNAVTGNITKTYAKSFFKRFHLKSSLAEKLFEPDSKLWCSRKGHINTYPVVVVQMAVVGDMEVIAEIMFKDDYEEVIKEC